MLELPEYAMLRSRLAHLAQHLGYAVVGLVAGMLRVAGKVGAAEQEDAHEPVAGRACPGLPAAGFGSIAWGHAPPSFVFCYLPR